MEARAGRGLFFTRLVWKIRHISYLTFYDFLIGVSVLSRNVKVDLDLTSLIEKLRQLLPFVPLVGTHLHPGQLGIPLESIEPDGVFDAILRKQLDEALEPHGGQLRQPFLNNVYSGVSGDGAVYSVVDPTKPVILLDPSYATGIDPDPYSDLLIGHLGSGGVSVAVHDEAGQQLPDLVIPVRQAGDLMAVHDGMVEFLQGLSKSLLVTGPLGQRPVYPDQLPFSQVEGVTVPARAWVGAVVVWIFYIAVCNVEKVMWLRSLLHGIIISQLEGQMNSFSDIRAMFDLGDVSGVHRWGLCPMKVHAHANNTPSFSIFWVTINGEQTQWFKCHGTCGLQGDVIDFVGYQQVPGYTPDDLELKKEALQILIGGRYIPSCPRPPPPPRPLPQWLHLDFQPIAFQVKKFLQTRGVEPWQMEKYHLGSAEHIAEHSIIKGRDALLSIPTLHGGTLKGIKIRKTYDSSFNYFAVSGSHRGLFGFDNVIRHEGTTIVCKGEIAAMVVEKVVGERARVCAPTAGETAGVESVRAAILGAKTVILIGDNDKDPKVRERIVQATLERGRSLGAKVVFPPEKYKDIDQFILAEPGPASSLLAQWMEAR
jgi:hypothetical protein